MNEIENSESHSLAIPNQLLNAEEVAQILRVPRSWVYSHLEELPVIRLGRYVRFMRSGIERFLEERGLANDSF